MGESNVPHTKEEGPSALSDSTREAGTGAPLPLGRWGKKSISRCKEHITGDDDDDDRLA